jgi:hypothetical protein
MLQAHVNVAAPARVRKSQQRLSNKTRATIGSAHSSASSGASFYGAGGRWIAIVATALGYGSAGTPLSRKRRSADGDIDALTQGCLPNPLRGGVATETGAATRRASIDAKQRKVYLRQQKRAFRRCPQMGGLSRNRDAFVGAATPYCSRHCQIFMFRSSDSQEIRRLIRTASERSAGDGFSVVRSH